MYINVADIAFDYIPEITSNETDAWMKLLKTHVGRRVAGLQESIFGLCIKGKIQKRLTTEIRSNIKRWLTLGLRFQRIR